MVQDGTAALANQLLPAAGAFGIAFSASLAQNLLELYDEHVIATATQGELLSVSQVAKSEKKLSVAGL